jgi:hypothetical protein
MARIGNGGGFMAKLIGILLLTAAFTGAAPAHAGERTLDVVSEDGRPVAQFTLGDSQCELRDDQVQCSRVQR